MEEDGDGCFLKPASSLVCRHAIFTDLLDAISMPMPISCLVVALAWLVTMLPAGSQLMGYSEGEEFSEWVVFPELQATEFPDGYYVFSDKRKLLNSVSGRQIVNVKAYGEYKGQAYYLSEENYQRLLEKKPPKWIRRRPPGSTPQPETRPNTPSEQLEVEPKTQSRYPDLVIRKADPDAAAWLEIGRLRASGKLHGMKIEALRDDRKIAGAISLKNDLNDLIEAGSVHFQAFTPSSSSAEYRYKNHPNPSIKEMIDANAREELKLTGVFHASTEVPEGIDGYQWLLAFGEGEDQPDSDMFESGLRFGKGYALSVAKRRPKPLTIWVKPIGVSPPASIQLGPKVTTTKPR